MTEDYTKHPIPRMKAFKMGSHMTDTPLVIIVGQVGAILDS
jgi:hypothetical protein